MQALKPKLLLHTAEYQLLVETHSWQMNGDWHRFHAMIQTHKLFMCAHTSYAPAIAPLVQMST